MRGPTTIGTVAVVGHRVIGADLFSGPALFSRLSDKILRSYALEYFSQPGEIQKPQGRRYRIALPDVHGFLRRAASANYRTQNNPGAGTLYRISSGANGEALTWRGQAVHIGLFGR